MTTTASTAEPAAALGAQDIGKRVLALIQSIHGIGDLTPANIEKQTGMRVEVNPDDPNDYGVSGKLAGDWYYGLRTMSGDPGQKPNRLLFQFNDQSNANADMTPVCVSFDEYNRTLTEAGFSATRLRNRMNTQDYWEFTRDDVGVTVYVRGKRAPDDAQTCVSMLIINAYA
ncbi:hypothetical protein [Luteimonas aquatica]|uniref:hypothetical protein n=1 Tax=Luteimonas aquatica TaxID=450364 RepID=UPI001F55E56C|nr:hypothetical protein [Luteimonas aquatica]